MARGQQAQQQQTTNNAATAAGNNASQIYGIDLPQLSSLATNPNSANNSATTAAQAATQGMITNPGYTPAQQSAITNQSMQPIASAFNSAQQNLINQGTTTNNQAGLISGEDQLAQQKAQTMAQQGATNAVTEANDAQQQQLSGINAAAQQQQLTNAQQNEGLNQLGSLYGINQGAVNNLLGTAGSISNSRAQNSLLNGVLGSAGGILSGIGSIVKGPRPCWVARAIYGEDDWRAEVIPTVWWNRWAPRSVAARFLLALYLVIGEPVGWLAKRCGILRRALKPVFDAALRKALSESGNGSADYIHGIELPRSR